MRQISKILIVIIIFALGVTAGLLGPWTMCCGDDCVCGVLRDTYKIAGADITLSGGSALSSSESGAPGTLSRIERIPIRGDLNDDGKPDTAVVLMQVKAGETNYYITAIPNGETPFEALPLGSGVQFMSYEIMDNCIWATVLTQKSGQPNTPPTVEKVKQYTIRDGRLVEI